MAKAFPGTEARCAWIAWLEPEIEWWQSGCHLHKTSWSVAETGGRKGEEIFFCAKVSDQEETGEKDKKVK